MSEKFLDILSESAENSREFVGLLLDAQRDENEESKFKQFSRTWRRTDVLKKLDISHSELLEISKALDIEPVYKANAYQYTLDQINQIDRHRNESVQPVTLPIVGVLSGKGGCSKTTFSVYLAQALVLSGKRVLFIDLDPQASATALLLGVNPDIEFHVDETVAPFMMDALISLESQVIQTGMSGLDIIPCCQSASVMDLMGVAGISKDKEEILDRFWAFKETLDLFREDYDVIVLDTPPTVTFTNIKAIIASNLMITPIAPSMTDVCSSTGYENTLLDYFNDLYKEPNNRTVDMMIRRFLITQYDHRLMPDRKFAEVIRQTYPSTYATPFANLSEISNTNENGTTVYEESSAIRSSSTRKKALSLLDSLMGEIFKDIDTISNSLPNTDMTNSNKKNIKRRVAEASE